MRRPPVQFAFGAWLLVAALAAGCGSDTTTQSSGGKATVTAASTLTGNEAQFGASARTDGPLTMQPDVVVLPDGANAIRSVSTDGMIWTIDGKAEGADRIAAGKVLLATSLAAGRVLAIDDVGGDKRVALGPVAITDLIKDGTISSDAPIPVDRFSAFSMPDRPGLATDDAPDDSSDTTTTLVPDESTTTATASAFRTHDAPRAVLAKAFTPMVAPPPMEPPSPKAPSGTVGKWQTTSICCTENGIHVGYDAGGARVSGTAAVKFTSPSVTFHLSISSGLVVDADVKLNGAASLTFGISAAVQASSASFRSGRIQLPVDIVIPIPVAGIPMNIGFQQIFSVNLGLSGQALLATNGEYRLGGSLGFSVHNGTPSVERPTLTTVKSALDNIQSLAVAPQGLTFAYALKTSIGVGFPGLSAGIWYQVSAALSLATSGAQLDPLQGTSLVTCKTVSLRVLGRYGVGYQIPDLVAKAINFFLGAVMSKPPPPVQPSGGPSWGPTELFAKDTPPCSKGSGSG